MRISAKADYAVRAAIELAAVPDDNAVPVERIATSQGIPLSFLANILSELRVAGLVRSQRGPEGGYRLAKDPREVTIADIIRAVEGPLATVRGVKPEEAEYPAPAGHLPRVWIAVRKNLRNVVEHVTVADVANADLPDSINRLADEGFAVVVISSYLPEIMALSDRILVARQGKIIEEMSIDEATEQKIMYAAVH